LKNFVIIFALFYYSLGTFILPLGDFSILPDLPAMYRHCKQTEQHDMNIFDFFKDHLFNVDCLFDSHGNGDEQKPHIPFHFNHQIQQIIISVFQKSHPLIFEFHNITLPKFLNFYHRILVFDIFRPPKF
jgi:hypothetical protein